MAKDNNTHSVMPKKLAEALMEAGVQHFNTGGSVAGGVAGGVAGNALLPGVGGYIGAPLGSYLGNLLTGPNEHTQGPQDLGGAETDVYPTAQNFEEIRRGSLYQPIQSPANAANMTTSPYTLQEMQAQWLQRHPGQAPLPAKPPGYGPDGGAVAAPGTGDSAAAAGQVPGGGQLPPIIPGAGGYSSVISQQQQLANALLRQSQGNGPSPAVDLLNRATGQNVQHQGALMASQRGASVNPALIARQAAMAGQHMQEGAVGQAAALKSQERLQAMTGLGGVLGQMGNQSLATSGLQVQQLGQQNQLDQMAAQQRNNFYAGMGQGVAAAGVTALNQNHTTTPSSGYTVGQADDAAYVDTDGYSTPDAGGSYGSGGPAIYEARGGTIPGKPTVAGNSVKNDKVPALLSPGEIVLPRSVTQSPNMEKKAIEFLRHLKGKKGGYENVAEAKMACGGKVGRK